MRKTLAVVATTSILLLTPTAAAHADSASAFPATAVVAQDTDTTEADDSDRTGLWGLLGLLGLLGLIKRRETDVQTNDARSDRR